MQTDQRNEPFHLLECCALAALLASWRLGSGSYFTYDTWWHLALGRQILAEGSVPPLDVFSYTAYGADTHYHSWLSGAVFALVNDATGLGGVQLLAAIVVALTGVMAARSAHEFGARPWASLLAIPGFFIVASSFLNIRPQLFTFLFLSFWLGSYGSGALQRAVETPRGIAFLIAAFSLWSNLHGGFVIGIGLFVALTLFETVRRFVCRQQPLRQEPRSILIATLCAVAGTLLHPQGIGQFRNVVAHDFLVRGINTHINEWIPPAIPLLLGIAIMSVAALILALRTRQIFEGLVVAGAAVVGMSTWRHAPLFAIAGVPMALAIYSRAVGAKHDWPRLLRRSLPAVWGAIIVCAIFATIIGTRGTPAILASRPISEKFPVGAVEFLRENPLPPRLFHPFEWGGFLLYTLAPRYQVYVDGRLSIFAEVFPDEYFRIWYTDAGWEDDLARRKIDTVIGKPGSELSRTLSETEGWRRVFEDETAEIFVR